MFQVNNKDVATIPAGVILVYLLLTCSIFLTFVLELNEKCLVLTHSFPMHTFSPPENIRKSYGFLMFSEGIKFPNTAGIISSILSCKVRTSHWLSLNLIIRRNTFSSPTSVSYSDISTFHFQGWTSGLKKQRLNK